ncbi:MAG: S41 family peptidase [Planctomycetota bacterium]
MAATLLAAGLVWVHAGPVVSQRAPQPTATRVKGLLLERFVRPVDERELDYAAARAMVQTLQDPFSRFMDPSEARAFSESTDKRFGGLGIHIEIRDGLVAVIGALDGTPAFHAGILPGDRIIEIDGEPHEFRSPEEAANLLKGEPGTTVLLTILRRGERTLQVPVRRAVIRVPSVPTAVMEDAEAKIGYVRVSGFSPSTGAELQRAAIGLREQGARAIILDLRANPGGYLSQAVETSNLFLSSGVIVTTRTRRKETIYEATAEGTLPSLPMCVLVNEHSASAAEILAGALKDAGVATIVGTQTYGKGTVQDVTKLADGSVLRYTIGYWYTRSGRRIHRVQTEGLVCPTCGRRDRHEGLEDEAASDEATPDEESSEDKGGEAPNAEAHEHEHEHEAPPLTGPVGDWGVVPDIVVALDPATLGVIRAFRIRAAYQGEATTVLPGFEGEPPTDTQLVAALEHLRGVLTAARDASR